MIWLLHKEVEQDEKKEEKGTAPYVGQQWPNTGDLLRLNPIPGLLQSHGEQGQCLMAEGHGTCPPQGLVAQAQREEVRSQQVSTNYQHERTKNVFSASVCSRPLPGW